MGTLIEVGKIIEFKFETWKKTIVPKSIGQKEYFEALNNYELVFGLGPAGTGKSYLAVAKGIDMLKKAPLHVCKVSSAHLHTKYTGMGAVAE